MVTENLVVAAEHLLMAAENLEVHSVPSWQFPTIKILLLIITWLTREFILATPILGTELFPCSLAIMRTLA